MGTIICILMFIGFKFATVASQGCPNRWLERPDSDSCYRLWPAPLKTWGEAQSACRSYEGDLLKLDSREEKEWIITEIMKYPASYEWWIGLNNKEDLNTWVWSDGTPRNNTFIQWGSGEPNNYRGEERCAEIWDNLLNDKNCLQPLQYICERSKDLPVKCDIDSGWSSLASDSCYKFFDKKHTYEDAKISCASYDATLVTNIDEASQKTITDFVQSDSHDSIWIGLKYGKPNPSRGSFDWFWQTGDILTNNQWWKGGRPQDERIRNESLNCVIMNGTSSGYGNWEAVDCNEGTKFICKKPQGRCSNGWLQHQSTCFQYQQQGRKLIWNEARGHCNLQGASLLELKGPSDRAYIETLLKNSDRGISVWIGLYGTAGDWKWNSGNRYSDIGLQIVKDDNINENEDGCVYYSTESSTWRLGDCGILSSVICTVAVNTPVIQLPDKQPQYECPFSWIKRENLCYLIRYDVLSWPAARMECQSVGGDLVTMNDKDTVDYVADLVNQEIWIGLSDRASDDAYVWLDTSHTPSTSFWKREELNGYMIGGRYLRNCVAMVDRKWITYPCSFKLGYLCQTRAEYNIAPGKLARQSSIYEDDDPQKAIEGCSSRHFARSCCSHTNYDVNPWWEMDMGTSYHIGKIMIQRRYDGNCEKCKERMRNFRLFLSNTSATTDERFMIFQDTRLKPPAEITINLPAPVTARYVRIDIPGRREYLTLCEVQVFRAKDIYSRILSPSNSNCYTDSMMWNGSISHTVSGRKCQEWIKDTPHKHNYHIDNRYPEGTQKAANSFCRDPDRDGTPWCYTIDPDKRWEYCGIPQCATNIVAEEVQRNAGEVQNENCGAGWKENPKSGQCYRAGDDKLCWSDAVSTCEELGGGLCVIQDESEYQFIRDAFSEHIRNLQSENLWIGIHDTVPGIRWKSIIKNMDISSLPLSQLTGITFTFRIRGTEGEVKNSNCVAVKTTGMWSKSLLISDCASRLPYICERDGKNRVVYTGRSQKTVSLSNKGIIDITQKDSLKFSFKGTSATLLLTTDVQNSNFVYEIVIGGEKNTRSMIRAQKQTKYTSFEKSIVHETEFRSFWLSWRGGNFKVGKGSALNTGVFMDWEAPDFREVGDLTVTTGDDAEGYWRFPAEKAKRPPVSAGEPTNIALGKETQQSSIYEGDSKAGPQAAVDGCTTRNWPSRCCTHTEEDFNPWWQVDLGRLAVLKEIVIHRRWECRPCRSRMNGFRVFVTSNGDTTHADPIYTSVQNEPGPIIRIPLVKVTLGRYVKIDIPGRTEYLTLCEVEVIEGRPCRSRMNGFRVFVTSNGDTTHADPIYTSVQNEPGPIIRIPLVKVTLGRYVKIDIPGRTEYLTLCEVEVIEDADTDIPLCGPDWTIYQDADKCFKFLDERRTWEQASDRCAEIDGVLAPIASAEEQLFMFEKVRRFSAMGLWFDTRYTSDRALQLSNGSVVQYKDSLSSFCETIVSSLWPGMRGQCFNLLLALDYGNGMWVDFDCSAGMAFVCTKGEKETTTTSTTTTTTPTTTLALPDSTGCPEGWFKQPNGKICFIVVREFADWFTARDKCREQNGQLAQFLSESDQVFFKDIFLRIFITTEDWDGVWIDGNDMKDEGVWLLDSDVPLPYLNWWTDQPDNHQNNEDCLAALTSFDRAGRLNDASCSYRNKGYVCQKGELSCEEGWTRDEIGSNCYKVFEEKLKWGASQTACIQQNAQLASISSSREQEFIAGLIKSVTDVGVWIGAHDITTESMWIWSDGTPWFDEIKWADDQPDNWKGLEDCGMLATIYAPKGYLNDLECTREIPYMCKKKATDQTMSTSTAAVETSEAQTTTVTTTTTTSTTAISTNTGSHSAKCGAGWEESPYTDFCYQFNSDRRIFFEAFIACLDQQSLPVSIITPEEQAYVNGRITSQFGTGCNVWMGLGTDIPGWIDNAPLVYFNWAPGEPNTNTKGPAAISVSQDSYLQWKVLPDTDRNCYICKRESLKYANRTTTSVPVTTTNSDSQYYGCPGKGWLDYKTSCYLLLQEKKDWTEALQYCRKEGAELASIADKEENDFIYSQLPKDYCFNIWRNNTECTIWAEKGECDKNPTWMAKQCHHACNLCYHDCRDKYITEKCMEWARLGECDANPKWMLPNCAQSCGVCYGAPTRGFWIGMTKRTHSQVYSWSDLSKPSFTRWSKQQPTNFASSKPSCVGMFLQTGTWNDGFCDDLLSGFVCKQPKRFIPTTPLSPFKIGCSEENSLGYERFCYSYVKELATWGNAESACSAKGGNLVAITDRIIQAFISSELVGRKENYWIGLRTSPTILQWSTGQQLLYSHFAKNVRVSVDTEQCYVVSSRKPVGLWQVSDCNLDLPYICQLPRQGYTTPQPTTTPTTTPIPCQTPWQSFGDFCYLASEEDKADSWFNAEEKCKVFGGNIASIHSVSESDFLLSLFLDYEDAPTIWIGINDLDVEDSFIWTDGSSVSYQAWAYNEPNNVNEQEHCGELVRATTEWNDNLCFLSRHYVCKVPRGFEIPATVSTSASAQDDKCGEDWISFQSNCYFNSQGSTKSWHDAREYCMSNGADLTSIHSEEENYFLVTEVSKNRGSAWLGLNDLNLDGSFQWSNGQAANYFQWNEGEPNDYEGNEKCVDMIPGNGRWNDLYCGSERSFVCKRPAGQTTTITTTDAPGGGCYPNFKPFGTKCFYVSDEKLAWSAAKDECDQRCMGCRLATIHSRLEEAFLITEVRGKSLSYWIGLNDNNGDSAYEWVDDSPVTYTYWNKNAPRPQYVTAYRCVAMDNKPERPGAWMNYQCLLQHNYICIAPKVPSLPTPTPSMNSGDCKPGYQEFGDFCYKLVSQKQTWNQAHTNCQAEEAEMVSVTNHYEQAWIEILVSDFSESVWIGLHVNEDRAMVWTDNQVIQINLLERNGYDDPPDCGAARGNIWVWRDCNLMLRSICKVRKETSEMMSKTSTLSSSTFSTFRYVCNENYTTYNGACYYIATEDTKTFLRAQAACIDRNMTLASIHSKAENDRINEMLGDKVRNEVIQTAWIGLKKIQWRAGDTDHSYFLWTDESPVSYMDTIKSDGTAEDLNMQYGYIEFRHHWKIGGGNWKKMGYICKGVPDIRQEITTTITTTPQPTTSQKKLMTSKKWTFFPFSKAGTPKLPPFHKSSRVEKQVSEDTGLSGGQVAGVVIGILGFLVIVAVIVYVVWKNWKPTIKYKIDTSLGFDNALFHRTNETVSLSE